MWVTTPGTNIFKRSPVVCSGLTQNGDRAFCAQHELEHELSRVWLSETPWAAVLQAPPAVALEFSRQEDWSGFPFPSAGDLPDPGIESASPPLAGRIFTTAPPGKPSMISDQLVSWKSKNRKLIYFVKVHWSVCACLFCTWQAHWLAFTPEMDPQKEGWRREEENTTFLSWVALTVASPPLSLDTASSEGFTQPSQAGLCGALWRGRLGCGWRFSEISSVLAHLPGHLKLVCCCTEIRAVSTWLLAALLITSGYWRLCLGSLPPLLPSVGKMVWKETRGKEI